MRIMVKAPIETSRVLRLLQDYEPENGVKFSLDRRKGGLLVFDVTTGSAKQACGLAEKLLESEGLAELPGLSIGEMPMEDVPDKR